MQPNVRDIHEWTGEKVKQIAGQGDIYIRTTYPLQLEIVSFGRGVGKVLLSQKCVCIIYLGCRQQISFASYLQPSDSPEVNKDGEAHDGVHDPKEVQLGCTMQQLKHGLCGLYCIF